MERTPVNFRRFDLDNFVLVESLGLLGFGAWILMLMGCIFSLIGDETKGKGGEYQDIGLDGEVVQVCDRI